MRVEIDKIDRSSEPNKSGLKIMPPKRKRKKPENKSYEIEVQDWKVYFHFGVNITRNRFDDGDYSEDSSLTLTGKILSPALKNVSKAEVNIWESQELDDHWKDAPTENQSYSIGMMQILRDNETLHCICWVPSRTFTNISGAAAAGKIKHAHIYGEKLKACFLTYSGNPAMRNPSSSRCASS
jgi:hypothetical protein